MFEINKQTTLLSTQIKNNGWCLTTQWRRGHALGSWARRTGFESRCARFVFFYARVLQEAKKRDDPYFSLIRDYAH